MDILYVVGGESTCNYQDLRYSLRSIDKYGINVDKIFVVGNDIDFLSDEVIKIPHNNSHIPFKHARIFDHIIYAINSTCIGNNNNGYFMVSMDDHYINKPTDFNKEPIYVKNYSNIYGGYILPDKLDYARPAVEYQQVLINTYHYCLNHGLNILNTVPHRNMLLNKKIIKYMKHMFNDIIHGDLEVEGLAIAINFYLSNFNSKYKLALDFKKNEIELIKNYLELGYNYFSTFDFEIGSDVDIFLNSLFPDYCKYEIEFNK